MSSSDFKNQLILERLHMGNAHIPNLKKCLVGTLLNQLISERLHIGNDHIPNLKKCSIGTLLSQLISERLHIGNDHIPNLKKCPVGTKQLITQMTVINLTTRIKASQKKVFDAARNIDIHQQSASKTSEIAIAGTSTGLINLGETVTWRGKHFGFYLTHKSRITEMKFYDYFIDEMEEGKFKSFKHEHFFKEENDLTIMKDKLQYETPFGVFGILFDYFFLKKHLTNFLLERNKMLKIVSEKEF